MTSVAPAPDVPTSRILGQMHFMQETSTLVTSIHTLPEFLVADDGKLVCTVMKELLHVIRNVLPYLEPAMIFNSIYPDLAVTIPTESISYMFISYELNTVPLEHQFRLNGKCGDPDPPVLFQLLASTETSGKEFHSVPHQ